MRLIILSTGRLRDKLVLSAERDYLKRLGKGWQVEFKELSSSFPSSIDSAEIQRRESELIVANLPKDSQVFLLDGRGKQFDSKEFSSFIEKRLGGSQGICFVIGGAYGFSDQLRKDYQMIALSRLTFPHQLARLLIVEQIYRAYGLINRLPYHK